MHKMMLTALSLCILAVPLFAQYSFHFACLDDTIQEGSDVIEFYFLLENTGSLPDSYAFDFRVIDSVPGWFEQYCIGALCGEPGDILYDYLDVGEVDSTIKIQVYPAQGLATEILNLHVQSIGNPSLQDSINVYAVGVNGIEEGKQINLDNPRITVYPNPFSNFTDIRYKICDMGYEIKNITLRIYNATGRLVKDLSRSSTYALHPTHILWDGTDDRGVAVPAGIYFIQIEEDESRKTATIVRLK